MVVFYAVTLMPSTVDKYDSIPATKPKREKKAITSLANTTHSNH